MKKSVFANCSVLTDFCHYLHLPLTLLLFDFFWGKALFEEVATVAYVLIDALLMLELNPSGFFILIALMSLMKIVWSFVWRKFSSVGREEWCNEMKNGQKLKLGDAHVTPRNIQEVQASKLGDAQGIPFFINKSIRSSFNALYFYCFIYYVLFLERLSFCFFGFLLFCLL